MFLFNLTFCIGLLAMGFGIGILIWAYRNDGVGIVIAKVFGYIITLGAIFSLLCTMYMGFTHCSKRGYFHGGKPYWMMHKKMIKQHPGMMHKIKKMKQLQQDKQN